MLGSQCQTERQEASWWQVELPTSMPPTHCDTPWSCDLCGENWTAPHWLRVNTAAAVQEVPLTVHCTIHIIASDRAFWLSSKWKLNVTVKKSVGYTRSGEVQFRVSATERAAGRAVAVSQRGVELPNRVTKSTQWSLGRNDLPAAIREMFMRLSGLLHSHISFYHVK